VISSAKAQDLIVTIQSDSIFCKIDRTDDRFVYYRNAKTKRTDYELISKREVKELVYDVGTIAGESIEPMREKRGYEMFQFWGGGGFSRVFSGNGEVSEEFEEYYDKLRSGFFYTGGFNIFLNESIGLGGFFSASNYSNSVDVINTTTMVTGQLSDDISLRYIGLNLAIRVIPENLDMTFQFNLGLGQSRYVNEAAVIYPFRIEGNAVGGHASAELQLKLGQGIYLPIYLRLLGFNINEIEFTPGQDMPPADEEEIRTIVLSSVPVNISRFQIGAGLCFSF
jgi:hypothetical protein